MEKKEKQTEKQPRSKGKKALLVVGIIVLVLAALAVAYAIWERPPELAPTPTATPTPTAAPSAAAPSASGAAPAETPVETEPPEDIYAEPLATDRDSGKYTILMVGRDFASNSTDTIIVAQMDTKAHTIDCVSIPRDTLINIAWAGTPKKINAVYPGFQNSGRDPVEGLKGQIRNLLGFDVDCFVVVHLQAVADMVNAIGGVWFDVPQDMYYVDYTQDLYIDIKAGYQLLDGYDALRLCRFRDGYAGGDIQRIEVQHNFLKAMASQILSVGSIPHMGELIDVLLWNVDTDLTAANIAWFARQFLACKAENINFYTMPWATACLINGVSFVSVDQDAWLDMVNDCLNPYVEPVTAANVNLLMSNGDGSNVWSTVGAVAGGPDSFYCMQCSMKNDWNAVYHYPNMHIEFEDEPAPEETPGPAPEETPGPGPEETPAPAPEVTQAPAPETPPEPAAAD